MKRSQTERTTFTIPTVLAQRVRMYAAREHRGNFSRAVNVLVEQALDAQASPRKTTKGAA